MDRASYRYLSSLTPCRDVLTKYTNWLPGRLLCMSACQKLSNTCMALVGRLVRACEIATIFIRFHLKCFMFLHGHPKLHTVRHITRSKKNERALLRVTLLERARRVDPGVMSQQGMLEKKNGAARSIDPGKRGLVMLALWF